MERCYQYGNGVDAGRSTHANKKICDTMSASFIKKHKTNNGLKGEIKNKEKSGDGHNNFKTKIARISSPGVRRKYCVN